MAEECAYYYWDHGYSCALKRESEGDSSVDDDTVHKYCWGYHYDDCPRYRKKSGSSGSCYLTSACVDARGLPDDCHELTVLRSFRDNYMRTVPGGEEDIREYYRCAPGIVAGIRSLPNAGEVFDAIYTELILPCVELIESGRNHEAYQKYKDYTLRLQRTVPAAAK